MSGIFNYGNNIGPLHWAAVRGQKNCIGVLMLGEGIHALDMIDSTGMTPDRLAAHHKNFSTRELMLSPAVQGKKKMSGNMKVAGLIIASLEISSWFSMTYQAVPLYVWLYFLIGEVSIWYFIWKSYSTDPGFINVDNDASTSPLRLARGELDRFSPVTDQFPVCYTCNTRRVLRSKHCSYTNKCVARFDHFCPWVSNDVGLGNQTYFVLFLASVVFTTGPGILLYWRHIFMNRVNDGMGMFLYALVMHPVYFGFLVLDIMVVSAVGMLLVSFVYFSTSNLTTNENMNWNRYPHFVDRQTGKYVNPFNRGVINNLREYFGLERLPTGGYGRLVNWRSCNDLASYQLFRDSLRRGGESNEEEIQLTEFEKAV